MSGPLWIALHCIVTVRRMFSPRPRPPHTGRADAFGGRPSPSERPARAEVFRSTHECRASILSFTLELQVSYHGPSLLSSPAEENPAYFPDGSSQDMKKVKVPVATTTFLSLVRVTCITERERPSFLGTASQ